MTEFVGGELTIGMDATSLRKGLCGLDKAIVIEGSQEMLVDALYHRNAEAMPKYRCLDVINATSEVATATDKAVLRKLNKLFLTQRCVLTNVNNAMFVSRIDAKRELLLAIRNPPGVAVPAAFAAFGFYDRGHSPFNRQGELTAHYRASLINTFASVGLARTVSLDYSEHRGIWSNRCGDWKQLGLAAWCRPHKDVFYRVTADSFELTTVTSADTRSWTQQKRSVIQQYRDLSYYNFYVSDFVEVTSYRTVKTWADCLNAAMAAVGTATFWLALLFVVDRSRDGKLVSVFKYRDAHAKLRGLSDDLADKAARLKRSISNS